MDDAHEYLLSDAELKVLSDNFQLKGCFDITESGKILKIVSRKRHINAVIAVYALWILHRETSSFRYWVDQQRNKRLGRGKTATDVQILIESYISYGDTTANDDRSQYRRLYNRDACAIQYLEWQKIWPTEVVRLSKKPNEGLDKWSKSWSKKGEATDDNTPVEDAPRAKVPRASIEITIRRTNELGKATVERLSFENTDELNSLVDHLRILGIRKIPKAKSNHSRTNDMNADNDSAFPRQRAKRLQMPRAPRVRSKSSGPAVRI